MGPTSLLVAVGLLNAAFLVALIVLQIRSERRLQSIGKTILVVEKATNGLTHSLIALTKKSAFAAGIKEEKERRK